MYIVQRGTKSSEFPFGSRKLDRHPDAVLT